MSGPGFSVNRGLVYTDNHPNAPEIICLGMKPVVLTISFDANVLPGLEDETINDEFGASIDSTRARSLPSLLSDGRPNLPVAETLLADALYFIQLNPSDCQRAVLIAAIACEVKVKDILRKKTPPDRMSLIWLFSVPLNFTFKSACHRNAPAWPTAGS